MKQMTKEELIEYFIEQLGDNEILGKFMTIEQIRNKLNALIGKVIYSTQPGNTQASWNIHERTLKFDKTKIQWKEENAVIVHELIHILSSSEYVPLMNNDSDYTSYKVGIHYFDCIEENNERDFFFDQNIGINEGITDFIAEQITGEIHEGYNKEKSICKILSVIIGEDIILQKYFADIEPYKTKTLVQARNIFKTELVKKYGVQHGNVINDDVVRVLSLSDQLTDLNYTDMVYGLNENGKSIQKQTGTQIFDILYTMFKQAVDLEQDLDKKIDIMKKLERMCDDRAVDLSKIRRFISTNVIEQLLQDDSIDYIKKLEKIKRIKEQKIHFQDESIDEVLFDTERFPELSVDEKLELYINLQKGERLTIDRFNRIYQMYVENGKIIEGVFPKKRLVRTLLLSQISNIDSVEQIDQKLNESNYYKLGEYYALPRGDNPINTVIFDKEGKKLEQEDLYFDPERHEKIDYEWDIELLSEHFSEDKAKKIAEQIPEKFKQYKTESKGECSYCGVTIIGDIIRLDYKDWNESDRTNCYYGGFYSVDENGNLELIPERGKTQNNR